MQQYTDSLTDIGTVLQSILVRTGHSAAQFRLSGSAKAIGALAGDGSRQEAYGQYRRGGDLETVVRFMRDCRKHGSPETFLEWKYILFEFNDSDEDVLRAQEIADDVGVDSLLFIITNSRWKSRRFTVDSSQELPLRSHFASVSPAAAMNATAIESNSFQCQETQDKGFGFIDKCTVSVGKFLTLEGWALDRTGAYASLVELVIDGETRAKARTSLRRVDVMEAHPSAAGARCGFMFRIPINPGMLPASVQIRISGASGLTALGGRADWTLPAEAGMKRRSDLPSLDLRVPA